MIQHESFLAYRRLRHFKYGLLLVAAATAAYVVHDPPGGPSGDTWLGYTLGGISAALIVWLMLLGVRKRSYWTRRGPLRGWLSAHVYLGWTLLILVPLHSGMQLGWNLHSITYYVLGVVVLSGIAGVALFRTLPELISYNREGESIQAQLDRIAAIDEDCARLAEGLPDELAAEVERAIQETYLGGSVFAQLRRRQPPCPNEHALEQISAAQDELSPGQADTAEKLVEQLVAKRRILAQLRLDIRYSGWLELWRILHVPVSFALVALVAIHVLVVFHHW